MAHFVEQWEELTDNKWVLSIVRNGFRIPFRLSPPLSVVPISMSQSSSPLLQEEIEQFLQKRAVERVHDPETPGFYSRLFLVPKKNGKLCPVIDLSILNQYIRKQPFKMETVKSVGQSILINDWAVSISLTDAYLHVPIHPQSRKYLWFIYRHHLPIRGLTFRNVPKSVDFHQTNGRNSRALASTCHLPLSIPRRLADKRFDPQSTNISHNLLPSNGTKSRFHTKSKEVRFDTSTEIHIYRNGISDTTKYSQGTSRPSRFSYSDYQDISFSESSFGANFPFSLGQTQCSSRLRSPRQTPLTTSANVSIICLET